MRTRLARAILLYRAAEGLSLRDAAAQIGIAASSLSRFESGGAGLSLGSFVRIMTWLAEEPSQSGLLEDNGEGVTDGNRDRRN